MIRALLTALLVLSACESQGKPPPVAPVIAAPPAPHPPPQPKAKTTDVTAQDYEMPKLPHGRVTLVDRNGGKHVVDSEIAASRDSRTRGLMWRTQLPEGTGMLFIFEKDDWLSFWMKNTLIPLDMIFVRSDLVIVGIVANAEPKTLSARAPNAVSMYVLEVPGGWCEKIGVKVGSKIALENVPITIQ